MRIVAGAAGTIHKRCMLMGAFQTGREILMTLAAQLEPLSLEDQIAKQTATVGIIFTPTEEVIRIERNLLLDGPHPAIPVTIIRTQIRIDPAALPVGEFKMIPGGEYQRMRHRSAVPLPVQAGLGEVRDGIRTYRLLYPQTGRVLEIDFEERFPHRIAGWRETDHVRGADSPLLTTTARRTHTIRSDYWNHNGRDDRSLRKELGL